MIDKNIAPRPAATVLPLRDTDNGVEVLLVQRSHEAKFMAGAYVFPGGRVDVDDLEVIRRCLTHGISEEQASMRLGVQQGGLVYYVACLRELFEEANLLIACGEHGEPFHIRDSQTKTRLMDHRSAMNVGEIGFVEMLEAENLYCDLRNVGYLAHWVTPVGPPRRFDTRFFVAVTPRDQVAACDGAETIDQKWLSPLDALAARERGLIDLKLPTAKNLEAISMFTSSQDVLNYVHSRTSVPRIDPPIR